MRCVNRGSGIGGSFVCGAGGFDPYTHDLSKFGEDAGRMKVCNIASFGDER